MDENILRFMAQQLRKPEGEVGKQVGVQMNIGNKLMNEWTIEELKAAPGDNILEIGMGNGTFIESILSVDNSIKYTGCDYSGLMIEEASRINDKFVKNGQAKFFHTDADDLPFGDNIFNKIFAINTIYFWEKPSRELAEIKRVLKPGGRFYVTIRPKSVMQVLPFVQYGFIMYSEEELVKLLEANQFRISSVIVKDEPEQESNGQIFKLKTAIACAIK